MSNSSVFKNEEVKAYKDRVDELAGNMTADISPAVLVSPTTSVADKGPYIICPAKKEDYIKSDESFNQTAFDQQQFLDTATLFAVEDASDGSEYDAALVKNKIGQLRDYYDEYNSIVTTNANPADVVKNIGNLEHKYDKDIIELFNRTSEEIADYNADKDSCASYKNPVKAFKLASVNASHPDVCYAFGEIDADAYSGLKNANLKSNDPDICYFDNNIVRNALNKDIMHIDDSEHQQAEEPIVEMTAATDESVHTDDTKEQIDTEWYLN